MNDLFEAVEGQLYFFTQHSELRQLFSGIQKKEVKTRLRCSQLTQQRLFPRPVSFAELPFHAVPLYRLFEIPLTHAKAGL